MPINRGSIAKKAIKDSGIHEIKIAEKLKVSRKTLYNKLKDPALDLETLFKIGEIIHYDFSKELSGKTVEHLAKDIDVSQSKTNDELKKEVQFWKDKYLELLEKYSLLK